MSDSDSGAQASAGQTQPPADDQPILSINAQYIKDLSFENPNAPHSLTMNEAPEISVDVNVRAQNLAQKTFEVVLHIKAEAKTKDSTMFIVELAYGGLCTAGNLADDQIQPLILIEAPRQLFPFARAIVSDAVRDGGFPPLLINPIDFVELYRNSQEGARASQGESQPDTGTS
jgi:preprotein translocase subunit SecB